MRPWLARVVATALAAILTVVGAYASLRTYEALFGPREPNPALIVWSAHIAMFWRLWIGAYLAGMVAPVAYTFAQRDLPRTLRVLGVAVVVVGVMIGAQGLLLP